MHSVPVPHGDGRFDAEYAAEMRAERPPFVYDRPVRVAVCFFGRSDTSSAGEETTPAQRLLTQRIRWDSVVRQALSPAKALHPEGDVAMDTFVFTTSLAYVDAIREVVRPTRLKAGESLSWLHSPLHSLHLMWDHAREHKITYDRVLLLRNDVVFLFPLPWTRLHPKLFYVANWCRAIGKPVAHSPNGTECFPLSIFYHDSVYEGVPDFVFLGQVGDFELVFANIVDDVLTCTTRPTSSCCTHGVYGGQLMRLYNERKIRMGRFMHHHHDFDLVRMVGEARLDLHRRNATWVPTDPNGTSYVDDGREWEPRRWSMCTPQRAYCRVKGAPLTSGFEHW